ncbi:MAG TPA: hypothetical protein VJ184_03675, partial [Chryseolinea sp.]|nr:hypothetical protein [Chryseolinea sp.]
LNIQFQILFFQVFKHEGAQSHYNPLNKASPVRGDYAIPQIFLTPRRCWCCADGIARKLTNNPAHLDNNSF